MTLISRLIRITVLTAATALATASCTRPEDSSSSTTLSTVEAAATTSAPPTGSTVAPTTTEPAPATTVSAPPTSPPPTTAPPTTPPTTEPPPAAPEDLELHFDGVLPFAFGQHDVEVVAGLTAVLGTPITDVSTEYPTPDEGNFLDELGEESYVFPLGRRVCYSNSLCVQFGAGAAETLILTGWALTTDDPPTLTMANGITVGSPQADHLDDIAVDEGGCYSVGFGESGGVNLILQSLGEPFLSFTDGGDAVVGSPDPADVMVIELSAGRSPVYIFADC